MKIKKITTLIYKYYLYTAMQTFIIIILFVMSLLLVLRKAMKDNHKRSSNLSVYEHPSTFKKPMIEMVNQKKHHSTNYTDEA